MKTKIVFVPTYTVCLESRVYLDPGKPYIAYYTADRCLVISDFVGGFGLENFLEFTPGMTFRDVMEIEDDIRKVYTEEEYKMLITRGAYETPAETCPYCGTEGCEADWVDNGIGMVQCGPYFCPECQSSEIGPERGQVEEYLTEKEQKSGWYDPNRETVSPHANTCRGIPVGHEAAKELLKAGLLDDPELKAPVRTLLTEDRRWKKPALKSTKNCVV